MAVMKIGSATSASSAQSSRGARPAAPGGGFSIPAGGVEEAHSTSGVSSVGSVSSVDALLALQSVEGPLERRRRAVGRAGRLLDLLDEVKLGLLEGRPPAASLERLSRAVREQRAGVDEPQLEGLLDEIDTRAAVELAKLDMARRAMTAT